MANTNDLPEELEKLKTALLEEVGKLNKELSEEIGKVKKDCLAKSKKLAADVEKLRRYEIVLKVLIPVVVAFLAIYAGITSFVHIPKAAAQAAEDATKLESAQKVRDIIKMELQEAANTAVKSAVRDNISSLDGKIEEERSERGKLETKINSAIDGLTTKVELHKQIETAEKATHDLVAIEAGARKKLEAEFAKAQNAAAGEVEERRKADKLLSTVLLEFLWVAKAELADSSNLANPAQAFAKTVKRLFEVPPTKQIEKLKD